MTIRGSIPEHVRKLIQPEDRGELKAPTQPEADAKFNLKREKELQENIARLLTQRNICFFRQRMDRKTSGTIGWPDFTFAIRGLACAVECKSPHGGSLTQEQNSVLLELSRNGWRVLVCRTEDWLLQFIRTVEQEAAIAEGRKLQQGELHG